jgi:excisionase family DNA binding protein
MSEALPIKPITVTVATALAVTGLGRTKFYELIKAGRVRTIHIGKRTLVEYRSLEELLTPAAQ